MADEQTTSDGSENFVVHESDGQETAAAEGSLGETSEPAPEPEGSDDDTDTTGEPDGDGEDAGEADDDAAGASDADDDDGDEEDDAGDDDADADEHSDDEPKNRMSPKNRINKITKSWREAEREAEAQRTENVALKARLDALEKKLTPDDDGGTDNEDGESNSAQEGKPDPDKFTYGELDPVYQEELMEWKLDQRDAKREAKQEKTRQSEAAQQQADKVQKSYDNKVVDGIAAYSDFEKVVVEGAGSEAKGIAPKYDLSPEFALMALESDVGHHVVYEVASDPEYSRKLAKMPPQIQAQEFGRLAAQFTSKDASPPKKKNKATSATPPPTSKVNGSGVHKKAAKDMDFAEFEKFANKEVLGIGN